MPPIHSLGLLGRDLEAEYGEACLRELHREGQAHVAQTDHANKRVTSLYLSNERLSLVCQDDYPPSIFASWLA